MNYKELKEYADKYIFYTRHLRFTPCCPSHYMETAHYLMNNFQYITEALIPQAGNINL